MKKPLLIILISIFCCSCATIPDRKPWPVSDKILFTASCAANTYDFKTTNDNLNNGSHIVNPWPVLFYLNDETPSTNTLAISRIFQSVLAWIILDRIESKWRDPILFILTGTWLYYGTTNTY